MKIQSNVVFKHLETLPENTSILVEQGGSRCFVGSTYVNTPKGYEQIRYINKGDKVYSYDGYRKCMTTNKVINKFIYEVEQPLLSLKLKNDTIVCTPKHRFLFQGEWVTAFDIARRRMERGTKYERKVFDKQFREVEGCKLQKNWTTKNNETCFNEEMQEKEQKPLFENNVINRWKIQDTVDSQISSENIYPKSSEQTSSKPYKWKTLGQQSRKLRMGNTFRKFITFFQNRFTSSKEKRIKWNGQINNSASKRNSKEIYSFKNYCEDVSKRVWSFFMYNKDDIGTEWKEESMAQSNFRYKNQNFKEIKLEDIEQINLYMSKEKVYDLEVENTHSYCITTNNIIVHNSGKTYNILYWLIFKSLSTWNEQKVVDIVRKSFPTLRQSVMFDFLLILNNLGLYDEKNHNKTENTYRINKTLFRFFSCDDSQKMRGPGRDILFCNEANELKLEDFRQLNMRTKELTILDYNPSDEFHWIYDHVIPRDDCVFHKTTYIDNPFLPERIIKEIEAYRDTDENYWRIYGMGERGISQTSIYTHWDLCDELPENKPYFIGLDFGYNHPTAITKTVIDENTLYVQELVYKSYLTVQDIIRELKVLDIKPTDTIYADCSRPEMIQEIFQAGFNVHPTRKGPNSVKDGIDIIKRHKLRITKDSPNLLKEIKSYKWKVNKDEQVLDEPVKLNDDLMDSMRYSVNELLQPSAEFDTFDEALF